MTLFLALLLAAGVIYFLFRYELPLRRLRRDLAAVQADPERHFANPSGAKVVREIGSELQALIEESHRADGRARDDGLNLRAILGTMREGVVLLDQQKRIRLANEAIYRLLPAGLSPINRTLLELFRNHVLQRAIETSFTTPEPQTTEYVVDVNENGKLVAKTLEVTSIGMTGSNGEMVGALAVFHDLTQLKALESMRKDFVANVSHELRTPLSIIGGYIETMLDDDLEDVVAGRKFLKIMHKHTERLHLLVEDLLTISSLESQRVALDFSGADLRQSIHRVVEQLEPSLAAKELRVDVVFQGDFPLVQIDARRMDQVFFNLLDNAIKHGRKGDAPIKIIGTRCSAGVCVAIRDHGPGIPWKDQPHIFERFYRVDEARSREIGGTGLGLSIVKHVVQAHGGTVEVSSDRGAGATFEVRLPLTQNSDSKPEAERV
ncbi:MAG TPA: ATP-binding protein [Chthoniobacterales bacterium]|jgi:two-component system phosphate regulon sensor histidine kinase PhoR